MAGPEFRPPTQGEFTREVAGQLPPIPPDQRAFMDYVDAVQPRMIRPLPDLAARANHLGVVEDQSGLADRLFVGVSPDVLQPFSDAGERPGNLAFTPSQLAQFGKEKSFRGAFFGVLGMTSENGTQHEEEVVVKQYPLGGQNDATHNAVQEVTMLAHVKELGLSTVDVVGVMVNRYTADGQPTMYVITRHKQGLESMDELSWRGVTTADMPERLHPVIDTLESLHSNMVFSGDPKFKNIGLGEDGKPIIFDLEHATSARELVTGMNEGSREEVLARLTRLMGVDFSHVAVSLEGIVYPELPEGERPQTPLERFDFELAHVMEPYHMRLMEGNSQYKDVLNHVYNRVLQQRREQAVRAQGAPRQQ
jgi:hypothetical protein